MSYGEFNNLELCTNYGFTLSQNSLDKVGMKVSLVGQICRPWAKSQRFENMSHSKNVFTGVVMFLDVFHLTVRNP